MAAAIESAGTEGGANGLATLKFSQYTMLFQPVFGLQSAQAIKEVSIDVFIQAVQSVTAEATASNIVVGQNMVRPLILHVVSTLDAKTKKC